MGVESWQTKSRRADARPSDERQGMDRPVLGVVDSVSMDTERINGIDFGGGSPARVTHPYVSIRSWFRVMPEVGTAAVMQRRGDTAETEITYYWSGSPENRISKYREGVGYYRPLNLGEFEMSSFGIAQMYASRDGSLDMRGGVTRMWMNNRRLEVGSKAPTYRRLLHDHSHDDMRGEERFGVVWRKGETHAERKWIKKKGAFAKEYVRILSFGGLPTILVDHREGHVFDDSGQEARSPAGLPLRRKTSWIDRNQESALEMIDENSNYWEILTTQATVGRVFRIPSGSFRVEAGDKIRLGAGTDVEVTGRNMVIRAREVMSIEAEMAINIVSKGAISLQAAVIEANGRSLIAGAHPI